MGSIATETKSRILNVGIIGCGELTQVVHIPTLGFLSDQFRITYLCDVSPSALQHCQKRVVGGLAPQLTDDPTQLCASPLVDVVLIASPDEYHADYAVIALEHEKSVFAEKPLALNMKDIERVITAEKASHGQLMVGYMRRYAPVFQDVLKEIGGMDKIVYARVRDIIGPNSVFVGQSGTFPKKFSDITSGKLEQSSQKAAEAVLQGLETECQVPVTDESTLMWRVLNGLGSHDLSVMREALGMPQKVLGVSLGFPFWNVLFKYPGFTVSYESGIDKIPRFDCHLEVYSLDKSVRLQYDTPYVKGLPTTMHVQENCDTVYKETVVRRTYEDNYTNELRQLYEIVVNGKEVKTTADDAGNDLKLFQMIMKAGQREKYC